MYITAIGFETVQKNIQFTFKTTVYAGDKSKMHSICSTPELAERENFLRWVLNMFASLLGEIQQTGASETAGKSGDSFFHFG